MKRWEVIFEDDDIIISADDVYKNLDDDYMFVKYGEDDIDETIALIPYENVLAIVQEENLKEIS